MIGHHTLSPKRNSDPGSMIPWNMINDLSRNAIGRTSAPWFIQQAAYGELVLLLVDTKLDIDEHVHEANAPGRYHVVWGFGPMQQCKKEACPFFHLIVPPDVEADDPPVLYSGDDLAEAKRLYDVQLWRMFHV